MVALHNLCWNFLFSCQMICKQYIVLNHVFSNPLHTSPFWLNIFHNVSKLEIIQHTHTTQLYFTDNTKELLRKHTSYPDTARYTSEKMQSNSEASWSPVLYHIGHAGTNYLQWQILEDIATIAPKENPKSAKFPTRTFPGELMLKSSTDVTTNHEWSYFAGRRNSQILITLLNS